MKPDVSPSCLYPEWPAAPIGAVPRRGTRFFKSLEIGRVILQVITAENIRKAGQRFRKGNVGLAGRAFRNIVVSRLALKSRKLAVEEKIPVKPLRSDQPLISVVIPCFNYGRFIEETIDSVLAQTVKGIEIIIVDGGSTDGTTRELLSRLDRPHTMVFLREGRHFVGSNRNFGIEHAHGRYICCLDADDTLAPTYFEKALFFLETYGYDCVSTAIRFAGAREGTIGILEFPDLTAMMQGNHMHTCAVFRRLFWELSGGFFDTGLGSEHVAEDWDFWMRLAAQGARLRNIAGEALFNYRIHKNGSLSSTNVRSILEQRNAIIKRNRNVLGAQHKRLSAGQAQRLLRCERPGGFLAEVMARRSDEGGLCLVVALPFLLIGGAERLLSTLCGCFVKAGWRVVIVTTSHQDTGCGDSIDWFTACTPEVYRLPAFLRPDEWNDFFDYLIDTRRPDCLLLAGSQYMYERLADLRKRLPSMAVVDLLFNTIGHVDSHCHFRSQITSVIAENKQVEEWFRSIGWPVERINRVESGIDTDRYVPQPRDKRWRSELGIGEDDLVVGYSGRMSEEKAPDVFIEVARLCSHEPRLHFLMTGSGPLAAEIEGQAVSVPGGRMHYLGIVDDIEAIIAQYDLLVLPSRFDGRPQVVLEALSMGVVLVASHVGGLPELVNDRATGFLCPPADARAFANHLLDLAANQTRIDAMKCAAREFAVTKLGVSRMVDGYRDAIAQAMQICRDEQQFKVTKIVASNQPKIGVTYAD